MKQITLVKVKWSRTGPTQIPCILLWAREVCWAGRGEAFCVSPTPKTSENMDADIPSDSVASMGMCGEAGDTQMC